MAKSFNRKLKDGRAKVEELVRGLEMEGKFTNEMIVLGCLSYLDFLGTRTCKSIKELEDWGPYLEESLGEVLSEEVAVG